jgi:hypothetical protein
VYYNKSESASKRDKILKQKFRTITLDGDKFICIEDFISHSVFKELNLA